MNEFETLEFKIAKFLRAGVVLAGIVIGTGWILSFKGGADPFLRLKVYEPLNFIDSLQANVILQNWGKLIAYLGLVILISLPVIRVFLSVILFIKQKEKIMALIGLMVLIGLILSFSMGVEH